MVLWLDDVREPWRFGLVGAEWVKTAEDAIELLRRGGVRFASLDHDLSEKATLGDWEGEVTGYDVMLFLEQYPEFCPPDGIAVHSLNPAGRERMLVVVRRLYGRDFQDCAVDVRKRYGG
jgi:hypothetical protein